MAWQLTGARGVRWRAANWIARNAFELLIPELRISGGDGLAERCRTLLAHGTGVADLADVLGDAATSDCWRRAVEAAGLAAAAEPDASWNEPARKPEFITALQRLQTLAPGGGNVLITDLAAKKI